MTITSMRVPVDRLESLEEKIFQHYFELTPRYAIFLGFHEYDGMLPDYSVEHIQSWADDAKALLDDVRELDPNSLDAQRRLDALCLETLLERMLFELDDLRSYATRPIGYALQLSVTPYISRDYAPVDARVKAVIQHLQRVPAFLKQAEDNLNRTLAKPFVDVSTMMMQGVLRDLVGEAAKEVAKASLILQEEYADAHKVAQEAITTFSAELREKHSTNMDFSLGRERFQKLLWINDRLNLSVEDVLGLGLEDLQANLYSLREMVARKWPGRSVTDIMDEIQRDHPKADSLIEEAAVTLSELEVFLRERDVLSIPFQTKCVVRPTPSHMQVTTTAAMSSPGPFEKEDLEGIYYVTPVASDWDEAKKEEWLRHLNHSTLKDISVHEVYPGHYTHRLYVRNFARTKTRKAYFNYAFTEGWAHYAEEMMLDQGYEGDDPRLRLVVLKEALLRDCRFIVSFKMHTQGMSLDEAKQFIMENSLMEELPARREALRGTFDHGYYGYTLGKIFIKRAREKFFKTYPSSSIKGFHDKLLSLGSTPVGLVEELIVQ